MLEIVADKIPVVDSINDWVQTIAVTVPEQFFTSNQWVPIAIGVMLALVVHLTRMGVRPVLNAELKRREALAA